MGALWAPASATASLHVPGWGAESRRGFQLSASDRCGNAPCMSVLSSSARWGSLCCNTSTAIHAHTRRLHGTTSSLMGLDPRMGQLSGSGKSAGKGRRASSELSLSRDPSAEPAGKTRLVPPRVRGLRVQMFAQSRSFSQILGWKKRRGWERKSSASPVGTVLWAFCFIAGFFFFNFN